MKIGTRWSPSGTLYLGLTSIARVYKTRRKGLPYTVQPHVGVAPECRSFATVAECVEYVKYLATFFLGKISKELEIDWCEDITEVTE